MSTNALLRGSSFCVAYYKWTVQSNTDIAAQLLFCVAYKYTVQSNNTRLRGIIQKTGGPLCMERAVDGKLKSNLEWP